MFTRYSVWSRTRVGLFLQPDVCIGAFLAGVIVPRDGGLAIALTEKLEDMVSVIFLPLVSPTNSTRKSFLILSSILHSLACRPILAC